MTFFCRKIAANREQTHQEHNSIAGKTTVKPSE
jgi:hypothetical protein